MGIFVGHGVVFDVFLRIHFGELVRHFSQNLIVFDPRLVSFTAKLNELDLMFLFQGVKMGWINGC